MVKIKKKDLNAISVKNKNGGNYMKKLIYVLAIFLFAITIVACKEDPVIEDPIDTTAPIFFGIADQVIDVGSVFNPLTGVTAIDDVDGDISTDIVVSGTYDADTAGIYTINFAVEDAAGNPASGSMQLIVRIPPESELFITNGDFSEPLEGTWTHWAGEGGVSTATIVDGVLEYDITSAGSQWYSNQFSQPNLTIPQGLGFTLEFRAKADEARPLRVKLENSSYVGYFDESVSLTTEWVTYQIEFFVTAPTITNGKLIFGGGTMIALDSVIGALTTVYLDDVKFIEQEPVEDTEAPMIIGALDKTIGLGEAFDSLTGITVSDNMDVNINPENIVITGTVDINTPGAYVLTYTLSDASYNETVITRTITVYDGVVPSAWLVVNGDFEEDQATALPQPAETGWGWHGAGTFTASISGGVATIDVQALGTVPYGVQFYQQNRIIEQGRIYQVTFDARADIARPIQVALEEGTSRRFDQIVDLTTDWVTYTIIIDHILPGYTNGKFAFFMGLVGSTSVPTTIYLDNFAVETIASADDTVAPVLNGVGDYYVAQDFAFDPLQNVTFFDVFDKDLTIDDVVVTGTVDTSVVADYVLTYTITDASDNTATYERTIHVLAPENMLDSTLVLVNGDFSVDQDTPYEQPAIDGWGWKNSGTGAFTVDISDGIMTEVVTNVGTVPHGTQFYQQNLIVETQATYLVTFRAKVDLARSIRFSLEMGTSAKYFEVIDITTDWVTYEIVFTVPEYGFNNAKFAFFVGLVEADSPATTFYLDDITIDLVGYLVDEEAPMIFGADDKAIEQGLEFDPLLGITVFDVIDKSLTAESVVVTGTVDHTTPGYYTLTYTLTDRQGNVAVETRVITVNESDGGLPSTLKIINGDFAVDQTDPAATGTGWGWHGSAKFMVDIADGVAKISIYETWTQFYGVQFYILNREVIQGHTYLISFKAKADDARPIQLNLESSGAKFKAYFDLTTDWTTFTYEYTHTTASITNGKFSFFMGNIHDLSTPTTVYLDDVVVTRIEGPSADTTAPQIWQAMDTVWQQGSTFDPMLGIRVYDHVDNELLDTDVTYTGTVNTDVVGDYDLVYTLTDASGNTLTHTRVISVVAPADMVDARIALVDGDFELQSTITTSDSNLGWTLKTSGTGSFDAPTFVDGALRINVTEVGTVPHGIQFFQRNSFNFESGTTYMLTFKAKAEVARDIHVIFENPSANYAKYELYAVELTSDWTTFNLIIHNEFYTTADAKIGFFLGLIDAENPTRSAATAIYFDDVSLTLLGYAKDDVTPMIYAADATVEQDVVFDAMAGVMYGDSAKNPDVMIESATVGLVTYDSVAGTYTIDTSVVGSYVLTYTVTDIHGNETVFTRNLDVTTPVVV